MTAEDETTKRVYTITVTRLASGGPEDPRLATLTLTDDSADGGTTVDLSPEFDPEKVSYAASVAFEIGAVTWPRRKRKWCGFLILVDGTSLGENVVIVPLPDPAGKYTIVVRGCRLSQTRRRRTTPSW